MIRKHALGLALLAVLASSTPGFAQDAPARFLRVATLTAAPGMTAQFEDTVRRINDAYKTTETGPQVSLTYATALGGNGSTYYIVTPFSAWGDVDGWGLIPQVLIEAYGEEEAAAILATGDASLAARETRISVTQVNFSSNSGTRPR